MKFRIGTIAMTGDLEEAFLQIEIQELNRDYLKFLWIKNESEICYRFKRLPFGLSCSPFILNATIRRHCEINNTDIYKFFYVDDFIYAGENENELLTVCDNTVVLMQNAGFKLRKWSTNSKSMGSQKPFSDEEDPYNEHSVLGMKWNPTDDTLALKLTYPLEAPVKITKRIVLSLFHRSLILLDCIYLQLLDLDGSFLT